MPELAEVEYYRRQAEDKALDRPIVQVLAPDAWYLKRGLTAEAVAAALEGRSLIAARRRGKLLLLDTSTRPGEADGAAGPVLGLRFGMTGRLVVDGAPAVDHLRYSSSEPRPQWDRFTLRFADGGSLAVRDPRRLGGVELEAGTDRLGPDALTITPSALDRVLGASRAPVKARLLDQARIAGVGNLAADEALWRAGLDPARAAGDLTPVERRRLHRHLQATMADLLAGGGSHTGDLMASRHPGGTCPRDGAPLLRRTVGGRTTFSCPVHQR